MAISALFLSDILAGIMNLGMDGGLAFSSESRRSTRWSMKRSSSGISGLWFGVADSGQELIFDEMGGIPAVNILTPVSVRTRRRLNQFIGTVQRGDMIGDSGDFADEERATVEVKVTHELLVRPREPPDHIADDE